MSNENQPKYELRCPCGYTEEYRSEVVAETFLSDHDDGCFNTPELVEL